MGTNIAKETMYRSKQRIGPNRWKKTPLVVRGNLWNLDTPPLKVTLMTWVVDGKRYWQLLGYIGEGFGQPGYLRGVFFFSLGGCIFCEKLPVSLLKLFDIPHFSKDHPHRWQSVSKVICWGKDKARGHLHSPSFQKTFKTFASLLEISSNSHEQDLTMKDPLFKLMIVGV